MVNTNLLLRRTLLVHLRALIGCAVAVVGSPMRGTTAVCRLATDTPRRLGTTASASAWLFSSLTSASQELSRLQDSYWQKENRYIYENTCILQRKHRNNIYMKRLAIVVIIMLCFVMDVAAQRTFSVQPNSVRHDAYDMAAQEYQRMNLRGEPCALLKVSLPVRGVSFGAAAILGDTRSRTESTGCTYRLPTVKMLCV